jgi:hypothetical protein
MMKLATLTLVSFLVFSIQTSVVPIYDQDPANQIALANEKQLELRWELLPDQFTKQQFGDRVQNSFCALEIDIANKGGRPVLIESIGFRSNNLTIQTSSREVVFQSLGNHNVERFLEFVFDRRLLVNTNMAVRTIVFLPRANLANGKGRRVSDPRVIKNRLGQLIVSGRELSDKLVNYTEP